MQLENNPVRVKGHCAHNAVDDYFTTTFGCNSELVQAKMCRKGVVNVKA
jgi:hypothetical protein